MGTKPYNGNKYFLSVIHGKSNIFEVYHFIETGICG